MIKSMTGYGRGEAILEGGKLTIEIRTLNGKNADISVKSPLLPREKELAVRKKLAEALTRGTIDVYISWEPNDAESAKQINQELALAYYRQIDRLAREIGMDECRQGDLLGTLLRMPDVVDARKQDIITEENWPAVEKALDDAIEHLNTFRQKEGAILKADVTEKVNRILAYVDDVEKYEKERLDTVRADLIHKAEEYKLSLDPGRLEQEMIYYLEKLDINEEKVRLRQHCRYFLDTLNNEEAPGKN